MDEERAKSKAEKAAKKSAGTAASAPRCNACCRTLLTLGRSRACGGCTQALSSQGCQCEEAGCNACS